MTQKAIVGNTRFSVALEDRSAWRTTKFESFDDYCEYLFDDQRLRIRKAIFFDSVLPSLNRQVGIVDGFRHTVYTSSLLPDTHKAAIQEASSRYPWLTIEVVNPSGAVNYDIVGSLKQMGLRGAVTYASFRLDDDDFLSDGFVERLSEFIRESDVDRCVSFPRGFQGFFNGRTMRLEELHEFSYAMNSYGLAVIGAYDANAGRILNRFSYPPGRHDRVDRVTPTLIDSREPMWVRCLTGDNDSMIGRDEGALARAFRGWKRVEADEVAIAVPATAPWL